MRRRFHSIASSGRHERLEEPWLRTHNPDFVCSHLDTLDQRLDVASTETTVTRPDLLARFDPKSAQKLGRQPFAFIVRTAFRPVRVCPGSIAHPLQLDNSSLQVAVV